MTDPRPVSLTRAVRHLWTLGWDVRSPDGRQVFIDHRAHRFSPYQWEDREHTRFRTAQLTVRPWPPQRAVIPIGLSATLRHGTPGDLHAVVDVVRRDAACGWKVKEVYADHVFALGAEVLAAVTGAGICKTCTELMSPRSATHSGTVA